MLKLSLKRGIEVCLFPSTKFVHLSAKKYGIVKPQWHVCTSNSSMWLKEKVGESCYKR